ncbi:MAG TPA: hypothetical protein PLP21_02930 [Pyrinomonadaceae bacterium]|nr:hypothetical protein [Acidobacteriota bacterium]HQZ95241.1 hypothetical protein [Pyrinomonadaceae bacterium]
MKNVLSTVALAFIFLTALQLSASAQDERPGIKIDAIAKAGDKVGDFVPKGWKIEENVSGDLNGDGIADHALKLIEDIKSTPDEPADRNRALVLVFANNDGKLTRAAVSDKLLQCTSCGGAFYGVVDAPANVKIEKGVLIVDQDRGSREVTETTYRFRYDEQPSMFILIGFDYTSRDRANGEVSSESTNYLTGKRITTTGKGKKTTTKTTTVQKMRYSLEEVDADKFDEEATNRLGLG